MCTLQRKGSKSKRMAAAGRHTQLPLHQHDQSNGPSGDNDSNQKKNKKTKHDAVTVNKAHDVGEGVEMGRSRVLLSSIMKAKLVPNYSTIT